jgi:hypothetical protein
VLTREGAPRGDEVAGSALEDDEPAVVPGARADVDDPVRVGHDGLVVLDHDDGLAGVDEPVEELEHLRHVGEVEPRRRLVEHVDAALLGHVDGELEPLALAPRQGRERLPDAEVAESDVDEAGEDRVGGARAEEVVRLGHRHGEHLGDVLAVQLVLEHRGLESLALAELAHGSDPRHHGEVGVDDAVAVAVGAGALGVRAEEGGLDAVRLREGAADRVEQPGVRRRVAAP